MQIYSNLHPSVDEFSIMDAWIQSPRVERIGAGDDVSRNSSAWRLSNIRTLNDGIDFRMYVIVCLVLCHRWLYQNY